MNQGDEPANRVGQVDRNTIGGGNGEEYSRGAGGVSVGALMDRNTPDVAMPEHRSAVDLTGDDDSPEPRHSQPERAPAVQHFADRRLATQAQVEGSGGIPPDGDPRQNAEFLPPAGQLVPGNRTSERGLDHPSSRSIAAPRALSRSWMCS